MASVAIATAVAGTNQGDAREQRGVWARQSVEKLGRARAGAGITLWQVSRKPAFEKKRRPGHRRPSTEVPLQTGDRELASLMQAAKIGDANAYERLLRSITPRIRGYARRRWPSLTREDVEDLVQDVLLSVHATRATYSPDRPFMPWLFTIAARRLADCARRHARQAAHEVHVEELPEAPCDGAALFGGEPYRDPDALRKAVQRLPQKQRIAIELLKLREMSLKDGAAASGMSTGALRVSIHRALPQLRQALAHLG